MSDHRGFRFATGTWEITRLGVLAQARKAESLGYDVFIMTDHLFGQLAPIPQLMMVAENIGLRVGTYVLCNDFRHPLVMAKEAATVDVLSDGRFELALGAGYVPIEYRMAGIPFRGGATRFGRLTEAVKIASLAFAGEPFSFDGTHYQVRDYTGSPRPVQQPRPPLLLGGGGRRLLTFAAAEVDIVSILPASAPDGGLRASELKLSSLQEKAALVLRAAGSRSEVPEINILIFDAVVGSDRRAAAASYLGGLEERLGPLFTVDGEVTLDDLLDSPYLAFGTPEQIAEHLIRIRENTGASYITVLPHLMDAFAPVLSRLVS
jgi:probable F420-dependent oxidoreductase